MDWLDSCRNVRDTLKKYRYVLLVLLVGLFLMLMPPAQKQQQPVTETVIRESGMTLQEELEELLSQLEGAGRVKVLLTQSAGERKVFQTNDQSEHSENSGTVRKDTVIVADAERGESGLVQQTLGPVYLGAVVLCQGAESASVRLAVIEAVSSATGLATHHISVLKMK